jgi:hypothetical protein
MPDGRKSVTGEGDGTIGIVNPPWFTAVLAALADDGSSAERDVMVPYPVNPVHPV